MGIGGDFVGRANMLGVDRLEYATVVATDTGLAADPEQVSIVHIEALDVVVGQAVFNGEVLYFLAVKQT